MAIFAKGNSFLNLEGYKIGDRFGPRTYPTANEGKLALFDDFWAATQDHERL